MIICSERQFNFSYFTILFQSFSLPVLTSHVSNVYIILQKTMHQKLHFENVVLKGLKNLHHSDYNRFSVTEV